MKTRRLWIGVMCALAVFALSACGGQETSKTGTGASTVAVTLQEWAIIPVQASVAAGSVTFQVQNKGPKHEHEFIVLKTELAPGQLETIPRDGAVNVTGPGITDVLEIDDFAVGTTQVSKAVALTAGKYLLLCNVSEDPPTADMGGIKAHFKLGMYTQFTVT